METPGLTLKRARELRRRLTLPEGLLWTALRGRRLAGLRFRRQHPIGPYIVDFYCPALRLAVEVDGQIHGDPDRMRHDQRRGLWLRSQGVDVFRIPAREVLGNMDGVLEGLRLRAGVPPPPCFAGGSGWSPSPCAGGMRAEATSGWCCGPFRRAGSRCGGLRAPPASCAR